MTVYLLPEAREKLDDLLDEAQKGGAVRIRRSDGAEFEVAPVTRAASPLAVEGISLGLTAEEIIGALRETRSRGGD